MKKILLTLCAALICTTGLSAQAPQTGSAAPKPTVASVAAPAVAGNWNMSLDAGQGPMDIAVTMKLEGNKLTGMLSSQMGDVALVGEQADMKVTFSISFDGGGGAMDLTFTGTMKDADNMTGTMTGPMGEIPWIAKRVKG